MAAKGEGAGSSAHKAQDRLAATLALDESVARVSSVSPARAKALEKLGIRTVRDLLTHYPRRYIDLSSVRRVGEASIGETCTVRGAVHEVKLKRPRPQLTLVEISLVDETGVLLVTAFRQPWLKESLKPGMIVAVAGKIEFNYGFKRMTNPFIEEVGSGQVQGMIVPVHGATEKMSAALIRRAVGNALEMTRGAFDPIPLDLRCKYRLMSRHAALACVHFPRHMDEAREARRRLAYEELLLLELHLMREESRACAGATPVPHEIEGPHLAALSVGLPFELTAEQEQARDEILAVMAKPQVANHMLLGDVGTGKTIVAAHALAAAVDTAGQAFLMAPTEVLATQHMSSLGPLLEDAGVRCALLTGSTPRDERASVLERFSSGEVDVLIGTHALLEDDVVARNLTLVVIDEQQRFGVDQRAKLLAKGAAPDALYLTATPIPRTLALALFGNLTLSYIRHRPNDRAQRSTHVLPKADRGRAYDAAKAALARGEQVYVVCPLIGKDTEERDSKASARREEQGADEERVHPIVAIEDEGDFEGDDVTAAVKEAAFLQSKVFTDHRVELLHGGMSSSEKNRVMAAFRTGEVQVLVATTVIEVGVDVPRATVMIIEDADRFGLSQLHQLRGRVGRGELCAEVFLVSASKREEALARLSAMETTDDGYELAAYDLSLRREGDILGNRQSGASALKLVNVVRDGAIIEAAHEDARIILEIDPDLEEPDHRALAREIRIMFADGTTPSGG